jgi:transcriptional regulator with XRE-family HTH domain
VKLGSGWRSQTDVLLGNRLKQERLLAGQEPGTFARALGISREMLLEYEDGKRRLAPDALVAATTALGVPLSLLFYDDSQPDRYRARTADEEQRWMAVRRPISLLSRSAFDRFRALAELWLSNRGRLPAGIERAVARLGLLHRMVLVRQPPRSSRLVVAHIGAGIEIFRPCESLLLTGRDFNDQHDRDYGDWVAEAYAETLAGDHLRLESVRARICLTAERVAEGRYDRLLVPWIGPYGDRFVMGVTLTRDHRFLPEAPPTCRALSPLAATEAARRAPTSLASPAALA